MSYHRDYHEFDFDSDMIDMMYGMTDLDKEIARKGGLSNINKPNKPMDNTVRLEARDNGNPDYIDYVGDIVGNVERGVSFVLTYVVEHHSFYATISDTGESAYEEDIEDIPHEVASTVREHGLELTADPFRMKLIAEAISEYVEKHQLEDDTTLNDFRFQMETAYQSYHNLHQDHWDFVEEDREKVHGAF